MSDTILTFDNIADYRYDPWTNTESPKQIGYGVNDPEVRTIPNSAPYEVTLFEAPQENAPSTTEIRNYATDELFFEVSKTTTPANKQYRVNYDEKGIGRIQFNAAQAGTQIKIKYYGLGTLLKKDTIAVKLEGVADYVFAAVDSSAAAQDMADDVVAGGEDFGALLNTQITALSDGGRIKIMAGTYNVSTKITLNNNVILSGDGKGTEIKKLANIDLMDITGNECLVENIYFNGNDTAGYTGKGIKITGTDNKINNCKLEDFESYVIEIQDNYNTIEKCDFISNIDDAIFINSGDYNKIFKNKSSSNGDIFCTIASGEYNTISYNKSINDVSLVSINNNQNYNEISNNFCYNASGSAIIVNNTCNYTKIINNYIRSPGLAGIVAGSPGLRIYFPIVKGNHVVDAGSDGLLFVLLLNAIIENNNVYSCTNNGIDISGDERNIITNNSCENNGDNGIFVNGLEYSAISNNICTNNTNDGIEVNTVDFLTITGNVIEGNGGGIDCNDIDNSTIQANIVYSNTGTQIVGDTNSSGNIIQNNKTVSGNGARSITGFLGGGANSIQSNF